MADTKDRMWECVLARWSYKKESLRPEAYEALLQKRFYYEEYQESKVAQVYAVFPKLCGRILDYGCGEGGLVVALRRKGVAAYGVDVNFSTSALQAIEMARLRAERHGFSGDIISAYDGKELPYPDDYFDYVVSVHVFEHVDDHLSDHHLHYLQEAKRVLKPGGGIFLSFPNKLYPIETHTKLLFFQWLPVFVRTRILKLFRPLQSQYMQTTKGVEYPTYVTPWKAIKVIQRVFPSTRFATNELYQLKLHGKLGETGMFLIPAIKPLLSESAGVRLYRALGRQAAIVAFKEPDNTLQ